MKNSYLLLFLFLLGPSTFYAQGSITGQSLDAKRDEGLIAAEIIVYKDDVLITGTTTDFEGNYLIKNLEPGLYQLESKYIGYKSDTIFNVEVKNKSNEQLSFFLEEGVLMDIVVIKCGPFKTEHREIRCGFAAQCQLQDCGEKDEKSTLEDSAHLEKSQAIFYPNPTSGILNTMSPTAITNLSLLDILGRRVISCKTDEEDMDLHHLKTGTYFLQYEMEGEMRTEKIIKI